MKRAILVYLIIWLIAPIAIKAEKKPFGDGLFWEIKNDVLIISGNGDMPGYGPKDKTPWRKGESVHTIRVEEGITYIGINAFCNNINTHLPNVREIFLPSTLIEIGRYAFSNLRTLKKIHFKEGLKYIGNYAFDSSDIEDVTIPKSVKEIGSEAFWNCSNLKSIEVPNSVVSIERDAFGSRDKQFKGTIVSMPRWLFDKGKDAWESCGLSEASVKLYIGSVRDENGKVLLSSKAGRVIKKCIDKSDFSVYYLITENGKNGIMNKDGCWIVPFETEFVDFDSIRISSATYYIVKNCKTSRYSIITPKGNNILSKEYDNIERAGEGYLKIKDGGYYGSITTTGKEIIPTSRGYTYIGDYDSSKGTFAFKKKGFTGICDAQGREISTTRLAPTADDIKANGGYASAVEMKNSSTKYYKVSKGGRYGLTDSEGREIVPCEMEALESAGTGYLKYKINGFWGMMDYTGKVIIDTDRGYTSIGNFVTFTKRFPYTMTGYKGECDINGRQISKIKVDTPEQTVTTQTTTTPQKQEGEQKIIIEHKHDPIPVNVWVQCNICGGSGRCQTCGGSGIFTGWSGNKTLCEFGCGGSGKCSFCAGHGGHYEVEYK